MSNDRAPNASTILADGYSYVEIFHEPADADGQRPVVPRMVFHALLSPARPDDDPSPQATRESAPS
ncbi:hypothetical protein [Stutzerimonas balearica]|uniref:hypothetical protein n=1 Tax=Stutzerimonas balearica TaxID=74829 RepID=UPI00289E7C1E|nr:hypothetical protein [Stutzerimonas balearica]